MLGRGDVLLLFVIVIISMFKIMHVRYQIKYFDLNITTVHRTEIK